MYPTGYLIDTSDPKDHRAELTILCGVNEPPDSWHHLSDGSINDVELFEQRAESCVGFSIAIALRSYWRASGIENPVVPSPLFIWWAARTTHNSQSRNSGTYIREAFKRMRQLGFCENEVWKGTGGSDLINYAMKPSIEVFQRAIDQKMTDLEYYRIQNVLGAQRMSWKQALSNSYPIVFGLSITEEFLRYDGSGYIKSPPANARFVGGHAMCALGYDSKGVFGIQTWGKKWGWRGMFFIEWEYIEQWAIDQWVVKAPQYFSVVS